MLRLFAIWMNFVKKKWRFREEILLNLYFYNVNKLLIEKYIVLNWTNIFYLTPSSTRQRITGSVLISLRKYKEVNEFFWARSQSQEIEQWARKVLIHDTLSNSHVMINISNWCLSGSTWKKVLSNYLFLHSHPKISSFRHIISIYKIFIIANSLNAS